MVVGMANPKNWWSSNSDMDRERVDAFLDSDRGKWTVRIVLGVSAAYVLIDLVWRAVNGWLR